MGPRGQLWLAVWEGMGGVPGVGKKGAVKQHLAVLKAASFSLEYNLSKYILNLY